MLCYRDRTFCGYWKKCAKGKVCSRALTIKVRKDANETGWVIARWLEKPDCFVELKP